MRGVRGFGLINSWRGTGGPGMIGGLAFVVGLFGDARHSRLFSSFTYCVLYY
jgi:hypothetical protein